MVERKIENAYSKNQLDIASKGMEVIAQHQNKLKSAEPAQGEVWIAKGSLVCYERNGAEGSAGRASNQYQARTIAAQFNAALAAARREERERCANEVKELADAYSAERKTAQFLVASFCEAAIREGGGE